MQSTTRRSFLNTRERLKFMLDKASERLQELGAGWKDATQVELYAARPLGSLMDTLMLPALAGAGQRGVRWYYGLPPFVGPQVEMDVRGFVGEVVIRG